MDIFGGYVMSIEQELHEIDRPNGGYTDKELEGFMVFCILDTSVPYEKVCEAYDALKKKHLITRLGLLSRQDLIKPTLKSVGYRWANQKTKYLIKFAKNPIDLKTASREEIVKNILGVGMKLASMFLRNTRGHQYAVIDVHTDRWIQKSYMFSDAKYKKLKYEEKEKLFIEASEFLGKTPMELDLEIWQKMRIGNRRRK